MKRNAKFVMGVTPVRALNAIKPDGIGRVANKPVPFWILRSHLADSTLSKLLTFLAEDFNKSVLQGTLYLCLLPDHRF